MDLTLAALLVSYWSITLFRGFPTSYETFVSTIVRQVFNAFFNITQMVFKQYPLVTVKKVSDSV
jgi:hypothetical protein